ncbi:MAG: class I SAM-dependent methyltransferase [Chloroflexota bacterium]|nr:MAG: class I SAM-dependent methyltransferase [Chloroflexota bacterium]
MRELNDYGIVADLYDTYVPVDFDVQFFLNEAQKSQGEVLELMSGTGRVSIPLLEAGVRLACVDISAEMLAILKEKLIRKGLEADLFQMDVCDLELSRQFDQVIIPFHSFAHITSPEDQRKALERIRQHLAPGGTFICTLGNPAIRRQPVDGQLRLFRKYALDQGSGTLLLWLLEKYNPADDHIVETFEFFEEYDSQGLLRSKRLMELHFRLTGKAEFEALAENAGFKVVSLFGDYSYSEFKHDTSPYLIWILRRST